MPRPQLSPPGAHNAVRAMARTRTALLRQVPAAGAEPDDRFATAQQGRAAGGALEDGWWFHGW